MKRARGIFVLSVCLYAVCTLAWALDVCLLWMEMHRFLPGLLLSPSIQTMAGFDAGSLAGNVSFLHGLCESIIVSVCSPYALGLPTHC